MERRPFSPASLVDRVIDEYGGVAGLVAQFDLHGLGDIIRSWMAQGPGQHISAHQLRSAIGPGLVLDLAADFGRSVPELVQELMELLPKGVGARAPRGTIPW